MSQRSDGTQGKLDMSAFEAEIEDGNLFEKMLAEEANVKALEIQMVQNAADAARRLHEYEYAMAEVDLPHKSLADKLRHLTQAYSAALELEARHELPAESTLVDLRLRIQDVKALMSQQSSRGTAE